MVCHSHAPDAVVSLLGPFADGGWGVTTFFGISGFLITRNLFQEIRATGRIDARAFWTKRLAKLVRRWRCSSEPSGCSGSSGQPGAGRQRFS